MCLHAKLIELQLQGLDAIVLDYIREQLHAGVTPISAVDIKRDLELVVNPYPVDNNIQNGTGWLYGIIMRRLEEQGFVQQYKIGTRSYVRYFNRLLVKGSKP